jgi:cell division septal protein FtsQ
MFGRKSKKKKAALDVKSRSKQVRAMRLRMATGALAVSTGLVLALFVFWKGGQFMIDEYLYNNPAFSIQSIQVETDGIIPTSQILSWSNVRTNQNLLAIDLARIKRDLELVPLIQSASVERVLPHNLILRVSEREPIARVVLFQTRGTDGLLKPSSYYLDYEGMVIPPVLREMNTSAFDAATSTLPTITGVDGAEILPGQKVGSPQLLAALQWLKLFRGSAMVGYVDIRGIDISARYTLTVQTEQGNEIVFALNEFPSQIARWRQVHDFARQQNRLIASLDLAVTNYVPAVWQELTNSVPPLVRPNTSPYRKRHV